MPSTLRSPGRPPLTQAERILNAVRRGGQDARTLSRMARVPVTHVHPLLYRLRQRGQLTGFAGSLRAAAPEPMGRRRNGRRA